MGFLMGEHATDEQLELYAIGVLGDWEAEELEEHLLICIECQKRMAETDEFVQAMRAAAEELQREPRSWLGDWRLWFRQPQATWAIAAAAALVLVAGLGVWMDATSGRTEAPVAVVLTAMRGPEGAQGVGPERHPLLLSLDVTGVAEFPSYGATVVDKTGASVWQGTAARSEDTATIMLERGYRASRYYVRLYSPSGDLLREYSLQLAK